MKKLKLNPKQFHLTNEIASLEAAIKLLQMPLEQGSICFDTTYPIIVNAIDSIDNVINSLKDKNE